MRFEKNVRDVDIHSDLQIINTLADKEGTPIDPNLPHDDVYNQAYEEGIRLNDIKFQIDSEIYTDDNTKLLVHGSRSGIRGPLRLDVSGEENDFSNGFYCGETPEQAGMFVADYPESSLYFLLFDSTGLKKYRFTVSDDWMFAVAYYRGMLIEYEDHPKIQAIIDRVSQADYIVAPIADNRVHDTLDLFINGEITDIQCKHAISATYLGNQYVFKTQKALDHLDIVEKCYLCAAEKGSYNRESEIEGNTSLSKAIIAKDVFENQGKYIWEILE